jgi:hypothetical protein
MDNQKELIVDNLKQANNILVTVSNNPSVDQLAACIGLTLALNKMKKHATAVFSGAVPPIIEFLQPEKTLEKTTDSLRDFIIAIDKAKADKLRYKVEDKFVKIFITPYRTSISEKDLEFSEGDFNVDVVLALGVHKQTDLDQAITAHGRILHDATVISVNNQPNIELGSINLLEPQASSLSEIAVELLDSLDKSMIDSQIATALLTGIVAETDRFRNAKTTPTTMSISAELLTAGANQQLVASKLEAPSLAPTPLAHMGTPSGAQAPAANKPDDGTLEINHDENGNQTSAPSLGGNDLTPPRPPQIHIDENGHVQPLEGGRDASSEPNVMPAPYPQAPPLPPVQPTPSPLNPFVSQGSNQQPLPPLPSSFTPPLAIDPTQGFGLPPLPSDAGQGSPSLGSMPYGDPMMSPLPPSQSVATQSSLPPLPPLQPSQPAPTPPPQQVEPSVVSPAIIQPDPNAMKVQEAEESSLPPLPPLTSNLPPTIHTEGPHLMMQPPTFSSQLTAGTMPQNEDEEGPSGAALSLPQVESPGPLLEREPLPAQSSLPPLPPLQPVQPTPSPLNPFVSQGSNQQPLPPPPPPKVEPSPATPVLGGDQTEPPLLAEESLTSLERDVKSSHLDYIESPVPNLPPPPVSTPSDQPNAIPAPVPSTEPVVDSGEPTFTAQEQAVDVESARQAINAAFQGDSEISDPPLEPMTALNAQPLGSPLHEEDNPDAPPPGFSSDPNDGVVPPPPVPPPLIPPTPS